MPVSSHDLRPDLKESGFATSVGYLAREHDYPQGAVSDEAFDRLVRLVKHNILRWMGYHKCGLDPCHTNPEQPEILYQGLVIPRSCRSDILVPDREVLYLAPSLILHYIRCHQYLPPAVFLEAVLNCPEPGSQAYYAAIKKLWPDMVEFG